MFPGIENCLGRKPMTNLRNLGLALLAATVLVALTPSVGWGQNVYGTITGTVTDASGAVISDAAVTLTNLDNGEKHSIQTNASGNYTFVNLLPGRYKIEGEKAGFKKFVREPIDVEIEAGLRVDIALLVGAQSETVEVTSETPLLQPETNSLGQVVEQRTITELPLNGRNPLAMVAMAPGVVPQGQPSAGNSSGGNPVGANPFAMGDFQIGGGQAGQSQILIDGVPTNGAYLNVVTLIPTQDDIAEFKVQTNNLGPEYGRFAGGVINLTTKSGGNQIHGTVYEFIRNKVLNANDFFDNRNGVPRPPFTQNQFGGNVGGPVLKDKLFYFGGYEGFRLRKGRPFQGYVPTAAERGGDFSAVGSANTPSAFQIYDATTSGVGGNPACNGTNPVSRTPFAGNIIPANRLDPSAVALLKYYPLPNLTGSSTANYATSYSTGGNIDQYNARADYALSAKQRIFGRYTQSKILSLPDSPYKGLCTDRCTETTTAKQVSLGDNITLTPTSILDLHFGFTRYIYLRTPLTEGIDLSQFGGTWASLAPQFTYTHVPIVCISEASNDGHWCNGVTGGGSGIGAHDNTYSFDPSFVKIFGKHTVKVGMEYRVLQNNYYQTNEPAGQFQFDAGMTAANPQNPGNGTVGIAAAAGGNGYASFLLGYGSTTNTGNSNAVEVVKTADQDKYWAFYAGDTFNLSRKITLNLGARVDLQGNWTERHNRIVALNPSEDSPLLAMSSAVGNAFPKLKGGYDLVASSRPPSRSPFPNWNHVSPRLGVSYQLDQNTVIRTVYGMFYLPVDLRWDDAPHNLFINSYTDPWLVAQSDGVTPKATLSNPFPGGV